MEVIVPKTDAENTYLCKWAAERIKQDPPEKSRAIGFANGKGLAAVVVLYDLSPPNVFLSWAADNPYWLTRKTICIIYDWAFLQLGCTRISGVVERNNKRSRRICEGLGMKLEGVLRKAASSGRDLFIYGLLKNEAEGLIRKIHVKEKASIGT